MLKMLFIVRSNVRKWLHHQLVFAQTAAGRLPKFCIITAMTANTGWTSFPCVAHVTAFVMLTHKGLLPDRSALTYPGAKAPLLFD